MDVSAIKAADTAAIHIKNAAGEPLYDGDKPVRIIVYGPGSRQFAAVETRQSNRAVKRMNDNDGKIVALAAEERLAETAEDLADITVRFENLSSGDKEGSALFQAVYGDAQLGFITRQVTKFLNDWGNFKAVSPTA